ncbi:ABC transporter permease [Pantanalinema sp. GBBB05]|uniref:ABC transporter permease n=1 Tax=Pantanalinema sp. GBBB05 TaxID=2604139 RepID=UPI001DB795FA|nr:ABC transporter permease [Pantanalinema sp. GBBB05]
MAISFPDLVKLTWRSLQSDWVRSGLTGLGVYMGVAAVSATLNIADITHAQIEKKLAERDKPYIAPYLDTESGFDRAEITDDDQAALKRTVPEIRSISSVSRVWVIQTVQFEGTEVKEVQTSGVSQNFIQTTGRRILQGRFFNPLDFAQYRPVAIVDQKLATILFKHQSPVNQPIYVQGNRLTVVGIVETKSAGQEYGRSSGVLWLPKPLAESFASFSWNTLQISPYRLEDMPILETKVKQILEKRHPHTTAFSDSNAQDLVKERELHQTSSKALAVVGLIALGIGGVGIANITVAAVLERTKEIGLRRAIGATRFEIMLQFILESVILSVLGGVTAIASVHGLTHLTTTTIIQAPYTFSWQNAALSMGAAIAVGVGSSFFPALRATQIDVVIALRE